MVSETPRLAESLFCTSDDTHWRGCGRQTALERLQAGARLSRTWGDCYGYLLVATGRAELMVDPAMSVWDAAALQPVLEEAGGTFTNWRGEPTIHSGEGIATNGKILAEVLSLVRSMLGSRWCSERCRGRAVSRAPIKRKRTAAAVHRQ